MPLRKSDVIEMIGEKAVGFSVLGVIAAAIGFLFRNYQRYEYGGMLTGIAWVMILGGAGLIAFSIYASWQMKQVSGFHIACPYCSAKNVLVEPPDDDFKCFVCHRVIPIKDEKALPVFQVRCGYCNELNYYSEKNDVLICEKCDHEIPLVGEDDGKEIRHVPKAYAVTDDERLYELVLVSHGGHKEELITALQHMLALNRNQVKQLLDEVPVTLLTGITRKKAELLQAQLSIHAAAAEYRPLG